MHKQGQVFKIAEGQEQPGLPVEVMIDRVEGEVIFLKAGDELYESSFDIINTFYVVKEEFNLASMPKLTVEAIDDIVAHFDLYAASESPIAGMQVKTKLMTLKDNIAKVGGIKLTASSLLGKKIS